MRVAVLDAADRILAAKRDLAPARAVERADLRPDRPPRPAGEALSIGEAGVQRLGVVVRAGADVLVEDVPVPELPVAAEVELPAQMPPTGMPIFSSSGAAIDGRLAPGEERLHPVGDSLLSAGTSFSKSSASNGPATAVDLVSHVAAAVASGRPGTDAAWRWGREEDEEQPQPWLLDASDMMFSRKLQ